MSIYRNLGIVTTMRDYNDYNRKGISGIVHSRECDNLLQPMSTFAYEHIVLALWLLLQIRSNHQHQRQNSFEWYKLNDILTCYTFYIEILYRNHCMIIYLLWLIYQFLLLNTYICKRYFHIHIKRYYSSRFSMNISN